MNQNQNVPYGMGYPGGMPMGSIGGAPAFGYTPQVAPTQPNYTQPLTAEEIETLRAKHEQFSLGLTQEELLRGICFHRDATSKKETLKDNGDGSVTCLICGKTFIPTADLLDKDVENAVQNLVDILQSVKLLYLDMPEQAAREFFQILPLIEKVPELYKLANKNFVKHENWNTYRYNATPSTANIYNMLAGGYGFGGPAPQQAMYGMPQQPMYGAAPQPVVAPNGMPTNGFGFGAGVPMQPPVGYTPQVSGYQYTPGATAPQQQPVVDATATVTDSQPQVNQKFEK